MSEAILTTTLIRQKSKAWHLTLKSPWFWPLLMFMMLWMALSLGAASSDWTLPWHALTNTVTGQAHEQHHLIDIVTQIRLPRALLGIMIGAALAISGASLQGLSRNPLADPGLLGISSGAAAAAVTGIALMKFIHIPAAFQAYFLPFMAFMGAAATTLAINKMAQVQRRIQMVTLLLAGIALNALFAAVIGLMSYLADDQSLRLITYWLMGSLAGATWHNLAYIAPLIILAVCGIVQKRKALNLMLLGEANAKYMGVPVEKVKKQLLWLNALAVGVAVSVSGIIGFVGLVIPHLLRISMGSDYRKLLFNSMWLGGACLLLADTVSRLIAAPAEVPIGIITSMMGAPVFMMLLIQQKKRLGTGV